MQATERDGSSTPRVVARSLNYGDKHESDVKKWATCVEKIHGNQGESN